jgi:DNA topoisomerase VI subunit A
MCKSAHLTFAANLSPPSNLATQRQPRAERSAGTGFSFDVPSRAKGNQMYVPEVDRIVLKDSMSKRAFASLSTSKKAVVTARVLSLVHELARKNIHVTKRDLFYTDVNLFEDQGQSDTVLDDVSCMLGCTRSSLHVVASEKGVVVGRLRFREDGDLIDCQRMGVGGKAIPPNTDKARALARVRACARSLLHLPQPLLLLARTLRHAPCAGRRAGAARGSA